MLVAKRFPISNRRSELIKNRLARNIQFRYQNAILGGIVSKLTGANIRYKPIPVISPLSSASLFCSMLKNYAIRNNLFTNNHMKRIESIIHPRNKLWQTNQWPESRRAAMFNMVEEIRSRLRVDILKRNYLKKLLTLFPSGAYRSKYEKAIAHTRLQYSKQTTLLHILQAMQFKTETVCSTLYPRTAVNAEKTDISNRTSNTSFFNDMVQKSHAQVSHLCHSLSSNTLENDLSNTGSGRSLIGVSVKLKGVRVGGALSTTFQKSIGRTTTNSVFGRNGKGGLVFEKASCQLRTSQGVVGLKLVVVYAKQSDMVSPAYRTPTFLNPISSDTKEPLFGFSICDRKMGQKEARRVGMDYELSSKLCAYLN